MFCCPGHVKIIKNEGTIIFGNITEYSPSSNSVTNEASSGERNEGNSEAGISRRSARRNKRRKRTCTGVWRPANAGVKKGARCNGQRAKVYILLKRGSTFIIGPFH